jgi:hypothetical protein
VASLKPSPENEHIYRPVDDDADIDKLAAAVAKNGCAPLVVTLDNFIVSGHRRRQALIQLDQEFVRCEVLPRRRDSYTTDEYIQLLREHNQQRNKTVAEQVREEMIDIDAEGAYQRLVDRRERTVHAADHNGVEILDIEGVKKRHNISADKAEHVKYVLQIVEERRRYWPLSVRGVHYPLLNYDFVRGFYWPKCHEPGHGTKQERRYLNDARSYEATSDLITRLRLTGRVPWEAFDDFTRPLTEFPAFKDAKEFARHEMENLFRGYWRRLQQSQPNHVEVVCEKNTIYHMVLTVTKKYQIPTSSGRGFNSIDPWHDLYQRYRESGKDRLIVIILSDFDPEGEMIPHVGGRTLRDDFRVPARKLDIIKAGVTRKQIDRYNLPEQNFVNEDSSNRDWFVRNNCGDTSVYELEALDPPDMLADLDETIRSVIDVELYNREVMAVRQEAPYLEALAKTVQELIKGVDF